MVDTIPDVLVDKDVYVNVNTLSGVVAGTALVITNKSTSRILLQISNAQPAADSTNGELLPPLPASTAIKLITALENAVWAKSIDDIDAPLSVQDNS
jgi:hypothetical protein